MTARRDVERGRESLRQAVHSSEAPYVSVYMSRKQAKALLDAVDQALARTHATGSSSTSRDTPE